MYIRHTQPEDIDRLLAIYQEARTFMIQQGNPTQLTHGYPAKDLLMQDIRKSNSYVCIEKDRIVGTFAFIIGEDPTYQVIENGAWHAAKEYGTIHRAASDGTIKGLTKYIFDFCTAKKDYVRIDTHQDNLPMQNAIKRYGFRPCGIIHVADGLPRIAFDYIKE